MSSNSEGRGFSVVAAEVKSLSTATGEAAEAIASTVTEVNRVTRGSVVAMMSILDTMRTLNDTTAVIAAAVDERIAVAVRMAEDVDAAAGDVSQVAKAMEAIEGVADRSLEDAGRLRLSATEISDQTTLIRQHVETFASDLASTSMDLPSGYERYG